MNIVQKLNRLLEKRWCVYLLLFLGAILTAFTISYPKQLGFLEWILLVPAAMAILKLVSDPAVSLRRMYLIGLLFFWCFYAVVFQWFIALYPLEFTDLSKSAALFVVCAGVFGLSLLQALFSGVFFVLLAISARSHVVKRFPLFLPFLCATFWVLAEWFQTVGWWGVPWGRLAIGQTSLLPMIQTASLFGSYFVSFLILIVNFLIAFLILHFGEKRLVRLSCIIAAGLFVCNLTVGIFMTAVYKDKGEPVRAAAIQGNISSHEKWETGSLAHNLEIYREYTLASAENGAKLIVWSETAISHDLTESDSLQEYVKDLAAESGAVLMVGAFGHAENGADQNAVFTVYPDRTIDETVYVKRHLVPYGEYVPLRTLVTVIFPPLANIGMLEDDLDVGTEPNVVDIDGIGKIGSIICFDSIYETLALDSVFDGAELLALPTNDSWFLDSTAIWMHNGQAVLRSVETGRYLIRAANTGVSSIISPIGEVMQKLDPLLGGYIVSDVYPRSNRTLYSYIGNLFVYLCMAFAGGMIGYRLIDGLRRRHGSDK